jgi:serine/threonine protein kinase
MTSNHSTTVKPRKQKGNTTRKTPVFEKLQKCPRSRIVGMESYKINCGKNLLLGYHTIKSAEETSIHKDDFVHVAITKLQDYDKPVVVKVYDEYNIHLQLELRILKTITGFRNTAKLICDFVCNDDKTKYITKIKKQMRFCGNGGDKLHFFVYEYIAHGDVSNLLLKTQDIHIIKSFILQMTCVIIELAAIYKIHHGDLNTGNMLIDTTNEKTIEYCIDGETIIIESHGIIPKIIDYGRSNTYKGDILHTDVWFDIILMLGAISPYIRNENLKIQFLEISKKSDMKFPSLKEYYIYIRDTLNNLSKSTWTS